MKEANIVNFDAESNMFPLEEYMPIDKCIRKYGKTYCWNPELEIIEEITRKPVDSSNCPREALIELLKLVGRELIETRKDRSTNP